MLANWQVYSHCHSFKNLPGKAILLVVPIIMYRSGQDLLKGKWASNVKPIDYIDGHGFTVNCITSTLYEVEGAAAASLKHCHTVHFAFCSKMLNLLLCI